MYLNFFQLQVEPFDITPDPDFLLLNDGYKEALGAMTYGIQQRKGFVSVVGEVGTGKTTLVHAYLNRRDREKLIAIYIFDPSLSFDEIVEECALALGVDVGNATPGRKIQRLHWALLNAFKAGKNVALIIDEAQNLPVETLEKLRLLSNFETDKNKLLQLVLVGQPELRTKLNLHELRQLKQRLALCAEIRPLTFRESLQYIDHRVQIASYGPKALFTRGAKRLIAKKSRGIPRNINVIADNALIAGYAVSQKPVTRATVRSVLHDRSRAQDEPIRSGSRYRRASLAAALVAATTIAGGLYTGLFDRADAGALDAPTPAMILPEPMAETKTQEAVVDSAEPETTTAPDTTAQPGDLLAELHAEEAVSSLALPPAPAANFLPIHGERSAGRTVQLDVIEPAPVDPAPIDAHAEQSQPERTLIDPQLVQLAAAEQMIVLHPVIPPFRLRLDDPAPAEPEAVVAEPEESALAEPEPRATAGSPAVPAFDAVTDSQTRAQETEPEESAAEPRVWRVRRGEFLWGIALRHYGYADADLIQRIRRANPDIPNINRIHPGDRLYLPMFETRGYQSSPR